jgi:polysaccharide pyruvyl transferase WcaK-like protein
LPNAKVLGWYDHANVGDEAYKLAFPLLFPDYNFEFVENISDDEVPDAIILGGGDVFRLGFTEQIRKLPESVRKLAVSISLSDTSDLPALELFEKVIVRDYMSLDFAKQAVYCPDFTFVLEPDVKAGREWLEYKFHEIGHELYGNVVVCVISNYLSFSKLDRLARDLTTFLKLSQDVAQVADEIPASFVFLPFSTKSPWDDRVSNAWLSDRCKYYEKNLVVWERISVQMTLNIIAASNACVSTRLHSSIFSTISGVPFIDLTHHTKNLGFLETIGKTEWSMPFWEFSIRDFKTLLNQFLSKPNYSASHKNYARQAKEQLRVATLLR